jgi:hypothetical protein
LALGLIAWVDIAWRMPVPRRKNEDDRDRQRAKRITGRSAPQFEPWPRLRLVAEPRGFGNRCYWRKRSSKQRRERRLAGYIANFDFWVAEADHCLTLIKEYDERFHRFHAPQRRVALREPLVSNERNRWCPPPTVVTRSSSWKEMSGIFLPQFSCHRRSDGVSGLI